MLPGKYEFNTDDKEIMEIISGGIDVLITVSEGTIAPCNYEFAIQIKWIR